MVQFTIEIPFLQTNSHVNVENLEKYKKKLSKMEPHQKMHYLFHTLLRKLFKIIGHDIFLDGEFKPYSITYIIYGLFVVFFAGAFKTLAFYDMVVVLNMIAYIGLVFEVTTLT